MWTDVYMKAAMGEKANSYPRSEFFIKHISVSWTNNLINLFIKPYNVKNLHGRDFFLTPQKIFSPKYFTLIFLVQLYHTMILPVHIYIHMHMYIHTHLQHSKFKLLLFTQILQLSCKLEIISP